MKIELTMTELMLIIDMIKNGTEQRNDGQSHQIEMRTPPASGALGFSKRQATALINGVFFHIH
jgi:hypothetical protein